MVQEAVQKCSPPDPEPLAITIPRAAKLLSLSERQIYYLISDGALPSIKIGRRRLIRVDHLKAFIEAAAA